MKDNITVARGFARKAVNDLSAVNLAIDAGLYDTACFHAQQAAEKLLKAFLAFHSVEFPKTHNLAKLALLCDSLDESLKSIASEVEQLTPYATVLRYDTDFWPERSEAENALRITLQAKQFVTCRLPEGFLEDTL